MKVFNLLSFDAAMAEKPTDHLACSDEAWFVVLVAGYACELEGLECGSFEFNINPPNPEILQFFYRRVAPYTAAIELFSMRH